MKYTETEPSCSVLPPIVIDIVIFRMIFFKLFLSHSFPSILSTNDLEITQMDNKNDCIEWAHCPNSGTKQQETTAISLRSRHHWYLLGEDLHGCHTPPPQPCPEGHLHHLIKTTLE